MQNSATKTAQPPLPQPAEAASAESRLAPLAAQLAAAGWDCTVHVDCNGEAMLVLEQADETWLVSAAPGPLLRLDRMVDGEWLQLEGEGTPGRILDHLARALAPHQA